MAQAHYALYLDASLTVDVYSDFIVADVPVKIVQNDETRVLTIQPRLVPVQASARGSSFSVGGIRAGRSVTIFGDNVRVSGSIIAGDSVNIGGGGAMTISNIEDDEHKHRQPLDVKIANVNVTGAGRIVLNKESMPPCVFLNVTGSGSICLNSWPQVVTAQITGAGAISGPGFHKPVEELSALVTGAGSIVAFSATKAATLKVIGSGSIQFHGVGTFPISKSVTGTGRIDAR